MRLRSTVVETDCQCDHWQALRQLLPKLQDFATKLLVSGKDIVNLRKENGCPSAFCSIIYCLHCEHRMCLCHPETTQLHFKQTKHVIGVATGFTHSQCTFISCFQCNENIDIIVSMGQEEFAVPMYFTLQRKTAIVSRIRRQQLPYKLAKAQKAALYPPIFKRGLVNLGQTCYMNCILQIFIQTKLISNFFMGHSWRITRNCLKDESSMTGTLYQLIKEFEKNDGKPVIPDKFLYVSWTKMPHVGGNQQHDAHEYFMSMILVLHMEFLDRLPRPNANVRESFIDKMFGGKLQSEVVCGVCRHSRLTIDPFWDLSLEMSPDCPVGITSLLDRFTQVEQLEEGNSLRCTFCGEVTNATRQLMFEKLPEILCIQLKRFRHNLKNFTDNQFTKIRTKVEVPESLDFFPYTAESKRAGANAGFQKKTETYYLHAFVKHTGSFKSGHYQAFLCCYSYWYLFDDAKVSRVSLEDVLQQVQDGYMLFYKKGHPLLH